MFDDIIVPKSYLRGLLTKDQEKLIKGNNYQTKCLENDLSQYKLHSQRLYLNKNSGWPSSKEESVKKSTYELEPHTGSINFYNSFSDENGDSYWVEFLFTFNKGVLDSKDLVKFELQETAEEAKEREEAWSKRHAEVDAFQRTFKYRFFSKLYGMLNRFTNWLLDQTILPHPKYIKADRQRAKKLAKKWWRDR